MFHVILHSIWTYTLFRHLENHWLCGYWGRKQAWQVQSEKSKRCKPPINRKLQYPWFTWHYPPSSWQGEWASARCWARDRTWNNLIFTWKKHQLLMICCLPVTSLAAPIVDHLKKTCFLGFEFPWYQGYNYNFSEWKAHLSLVQLCLNLTSSIARHKDDRVDPGSPTSTSWWSLKLFGLTGILL